MYKAIPPDFTNQNIIQNVISLEGSVPPTELHLLVLGFTKITDGLKTAGSLSVLKAFSYFCRYLGSSASSKKPGGLKRAKQGIKADRA